MKYYWRMEKDGELLGPTFNENHSNENEILREIKEIMCLDELPGDFRLVESVSCPYGCSQDQKNKYQKFKKESEETNSKNAFLLIQKIADIDGVTEVTTWSGCRQHIKTPFGNGIEVSFSHQMVRLGFYKGPVFGLNDEKDVEKLRKEISKRIKSREARAKKSKNVRGRTTRIGSFVMNEKTTIERATFEVYLDSDDVVNADVHVIGKVKFYKSSWRNAMFDIDERKILTRDGLNEIEATNTNYVFDCLLQCLAGHKE